MRGMKMILMFFEKCKAWKSMWETDEVNTSLTLFANISALKIEEWVIFFGYAFPVRTGEKNIIDILFWILRPTKLMHSFTNTEKNWPIVIALSSLCFLLKSYIIDETIFQNYRLIIFAVFFFLNKKGFCSHYF